MEYLSQFYAEMYQLNDTFQKHLQDSNNFLLKKILKLENKCENCKIYCQTDFNARCPA